MWVGTHPTKPTNQPTNQKHGNGNGQWQWQTHSLYLRSRGRSGLELKNEWRKVKGKETHITIKSTQLNPNHHITIKQTSNAKNESKSNQFLSKKNTHNFFLSSSL
jgi:hypothetical protein